MPVHYFPDTNVLINGLTYGDSDDDIHSKLLVNNTSRQGALRGFIVSGVAEEYGGITSDELINHITRNIQKFVESHRSNSMPIFKRELKDLIDNNDKPSWRLMGESLLIRLKDANNFDKTVIIETALDISTKLKQNKKVVGNIFNFCEKIEVNDSDEILQHLKKLFPIHKKDDARDNNNLRESVGVCQSLDIDGYFVTTDNLRVSIRNFEKRAEELTRLCKRLLNRGFSIKKLEKFVQVEDVRTTLRSDLRVLF